MLRRKSRKKPKAKLHKIQFQLLIFTCCCGHTTWAKQTANLFCGACGQPVAIWDDLGFADWGDELLNSLDLWRVSVPGIKAPKSSRNSFPTAQR